jgi:hypothetical protein
LLLSLELHRNKNVIIALAVLSVFLFGANASYASHLDPDHPVAYRTQLAQDLDGDHKPETATVRQGGNVYNISIHFTTGRPKVRLTTYLTEGIAGLSFHARDINNDSKGDLVVVSATSVRPIAIWLNQGRARFQKVNSWIYGGVGRYNGPAYQVNGTSQPEPVGNISIDPMPQTTPASSFVILDEAVALLSFEQDERPFDSWFRQVAPRGPPSTSHV